MHRERANDTHVKFLAIQADSFSVDGEPDWTDGRCYRPSSFDASEVEVHIWARYWSVDCQCGCLWESEEIRRRWPDHRLIAFNVTIDEALRAFTHWYRHVYMPEHQRREEWRRQRREQNAARKSRRAEQSRREEDVEAALIAEAQRAGRARRGRLSVEELACCQGWGWPRSPSCIHVPDDDELTLAEQGAYRCN